MDNIVEFTSMATIVLLLSLLVERIMEVLSAARDYLEWKYRWDRYYNSKAEKLKEKYENEAKSQILFRVLTLTPLVRQIRHATRAHRKGHSSAITVISAEMIRHSILQSSSWVASSIIGIIFCMLSHINVLAFFSEQLPAQAGQVLLKWPEPLQIVIGGVLVGLGSQPIHNMIVSMEKKRASKAQEAELKQRLSAQGR